MASDKPQPYLGVTVSCAVISTPPASFAASQVQAARVEFWKTENAVNLPPDTRHFFCPFLIVSHLSVRTIVRPGTHSDQRRGGKETIHILSYVLQSTPDQAQAIHP